MRRIKICYKTCRLATQTVGHNLPGLQGIKRCIQSQVSKPHKHIFYISNYYYGSNVIRLTWSGNQVEDYTNNNSLECYQDADHAKIINIIRSDSGILNTLIGVAVLWKVQIKLAIESDSTDG